MCVSCQITRYKCEHHLRLLSLSIKTANTHRYNKSTGRGHTASARPSEEKDSAQTERKNRWKTVTIFGERQHIAYMLSAPYVIARPSSCHTGESYKNGRGWEVKFSPYGSPIPLVFVGLVSSKNSNGFPQSGVSNNGGVVKTSHF